MFILKPDGKYEVVPGSQMTVKRQALRNNSSQYYVNDRSKPFSEVQELLKARGIDLVHNRFLILQARIIGDCLSTFLSDLLQGEVEQIAMMKPKAQTEHDEGLLEYIEDIIGFELIYQPLGFYCNIFRQLQHVQGRHCRSRRERRGTERATQRAP